MRAVSLVHLPSVSVRAGKLVRDAKKTKAAPAAAVAHKLVLGENVNQGRRTVVSLGREERLRHMYIVGATGTGKSTLLLSLIAQDIEHGQGIAVLDPHGDLIDKILGHIPEERLGDVILIDPSDAMGARQVREHCRHDDSCARLLEGAIRALGLSARGYARVLKVAWTIADLAGEPRIGRPKSIQNVVEKTGGQ